MISGRRVISREDAPRVQVHRGGGRTHRERARDHGGAFEVPKGGETVWAEAALTRAVREGAVCHPDEVVGARKHVAVVLPPLTDERRILPIDRTGDEIAAAPRIEPGAWSEAGTTQTSSHWNAIAPSGDGEGRWPLCRSAARGPPPTRSTGGIRISAVRPPGRPHSTLERKTPGKAYWRGLDLPAEA